MAFRPLILAAIIIATNTAYADTRIIRNETYHAAQKRPPNTARAPTIHTNYKCALPITGGVGGQYIALALGTVNESKTCITFMLADRAARKNDTELETALLCTIKIQRKASESIGRPCPGKKRAKKKGCQYPTERCKKR
jgi:hypothetical protein